MVGPT
ncbi:hypothetical protein EE612_059386 [Oryza sativa]